jgi:hypothetical protein
MLYHQKIHEQTVLSMTNSLGYPPSKKKGAKAPLFL